MGMYSAKSWYSKELKPSPLEPGATGLTFEIWKLQGSPTAFNFSKNEKIFSLENQIHVSIMLLYSSKIESSSDSIFMYFQMGLNSRISKSVNLAYVQHDRYTEFGYGELYSTHAALISFLIIYTFRW